MQFVIFHGSFGSSEGNWFPNLKTKLEHIGQVVLCPQYPIDDRTTMKEDESSLYNQSLTTWLETFEHEVLPKLDQSEKICFIGHSLGNVFILHIVEKYQLKLDSAIFVSPFLDTLPNSPWQFERVNHTFYKTDFDWKQLNELIPISYALYSDTDIYVRPIDALNFANPMNSSKIIVKGGGHLNASVNLYDFPLVYDLCVTRIDLTLYQKFAFHQEVEAVVNTLRHEDKKFVVMSPEQLNDEGTFHFMHLQKGGFATFLSNSVEWNPRDDYFEGGRKLAKAGLDLTRVFVIVQPSDLERKVLQEQMRLDQKSGIKVYTINYEELKKIGCEEDFGIWDNEYICVQHHDKNGLITSGVIDARVKSLLTAQNWRDRILRAATEVT
jgi:predicted alpha/beta hydrolase family esterase